MGREREREYIKKSSVWCELYFVGLLMLLFALTECATASYQGPLAFWL